MKDLIDDIIKVGDTMNIKIYQGGLKYIFCNTIKRLYEGEVVFHHSLDKGIYATIIADEVIGEKEVEEIKKQMQMTIDEDIAFNKHVLNKNEAIKFFTMKGEKEKAANVLNVTSSTVTLYEFEGQYNYFYTPEMPRTSKDIELFDIHYVNDNEVVLIYPTDQKIEFVFRKRIYGSFRQYHDWLNKLNLNYVCDVNNIVAEGNIRDLIRKNDIMIDNNLYEIAKDVIDKNKRIVLIAGPSSSGKTTTSKKMSLYLSSLGYNARPISLDDFFVDRAYTPLDEDGKRDYECLEALEVDLFNNVLSSLLNGEEVHMPRYDFLKGEKEFAQEPLQVTESDILVIEGLHALNPDLIKSNISDECYKIYISPLTPLNVDRHNYISTTDNRLLRRIVRDFRTRGRSCEASLATWASVRRGEEKYIFPFTDTCDAILNTAYVYEIGVLKVYVEPLLLSIPVDSDFYEEARRLIDELNSFYTIPSEYVSRDNLLREFIGGSSFEEEK